VISESQRDREHPLPPLNLTYFPSTILKSPHLQLLGLELGVQLPSQHGQEEGPEHGPLLPERLLHQSSPSPLYSTGDLTVTHPSPYATPRRETLNPLRNLYLA